MSDPGDPLGVAGNRKRNEPGAISNLSILKGVGPLGVKYPPANPGATGDVGSIPGSGRFSGGRNGNLL